MATMQWASKIVGEGKHARPLDDHPFLPDGEVDEAGQSSAPRARTHRGTPCGRSKTAAGCALTPILDNFAAPA
jgi:hypothetical protein